MDNEELRARTHRRRLWLLIGGIALSIALTVAFVFALFSFIGKLTKQYGFDEKVQTFLESIIEEDNDKLHSVSYDQSFDAGELAEALRQEGIELAGEVQIKLSLNVSIQLGSGKTSAEGKYLVTVGENRYTVSFTYLKDENGDGLTGLWIKPR